MLSVIIPAYNEERRIGASIETIARAFAGMDYRLLISDDGSTDRTANIVREYAYANQHVVLVSTPTNQGKGQAIKNALARCEGTAVLITDADLSTPVETAFAMLPFVDRHGIVAASRTVPGSTDNDTPTARKIIRRLAKTLARALFNLSVTDPQCGFKLLSKEMIAPVLEKSTASRYGFDVEMLLIAQAAGLRPYEHPVTWTYASGSKVRIGKDSLETLREWLRIRRNLLRGQYE